MDERLATPNPAAARPTPSHVIVIATVLACLPILAVCQFANLARIDDIDSVFFAYYGKRLIAGQKLYADLWDNKPPGIFWMDAVGLWVSQGRYWGIAAIVSLTTVGSSVMFFLNARRVFGITSAAIGTVMAALYVNFYYYHVGANRPSTFYVFFELCVLFFYLRSFDRDVSASRNRFCAGAAAVCAMCFRQTAFSAAAAIVVHQCYLLISRRQGGAQFVKTLAACIAGGIAALLVVVALLASTSDLRWAWHGVVASNLGYVTQSGQSHVLPTEVFHWDDHVKVLGLPAVLAIAAVVHAMAMGIYGGKSKNTIAKLGGPKSVFVLLVAWVPIAGYLALIGPHRAHHYYGIALAPLVMLATSGVWLLMRRDDEARAPRYYVILAVLWFVYMAIPVGKLQAQCTLRAHFQRFDDRYVDRWDTTIEAINTYTKPTDRLFCLRYLPVVCWETNRPQAHRYLLETLIDQWREQSQPYIDEVIRDLEASPPKAIVASGSDIKEMENPRVPITYRDLSEWLHSNYTLVSKPAKSGVWIRND